MSATTTAICVIVIGTAGGTMRPPLPLAIWYLLGRSHVGIASGAAQHPHAPLGAVAALDQPDPGDLLEPADPGEQFLPGPPPSPEDRHEPASSRQSIRSVPAHPLVLAVSIRRAGDIKCRPGPPADLPARAGAARRVR